jgi:hypothetical protein
MAQFYYNGTLVSEQPVEQFLWFVLFDAIHHRSWLSAYLRPVGASLPSNYGPSADKQNSISQGLVQTINPGPKWATGGALEHLPRPTLVDTTDRLVL